MEDEKVHTVSNRCHLLDVTGDVTQETCDREAGDVVRGSVVEPELPFLDGAGAVKKEAAPARAPALICV